MWVLDGGADVSELLVSLNEFQRRRGQCHGLVVETQAYSLSLLGMTPNSTMCRPQPRLLEERRRRRRKRRKTKGPAGTRQLSSTTARVGLGTGTKVP